MSLGISSACRAYARLAGVAPSVANPRRASFRRLPLVPTTVSRFTARHDAHAEKYVYAAATAEAPDPPSKLAPDRRRGKFPKQNIARNTWFRETFRNPDEAKVKAKLQSPFTLPARVYPSERVTQRSEKENLASAKVQASHEMIWSHYKPERHFVVADLRWSDTFELLKSLTKPSTGAGADRMSAMRIVLPKSFDLEVSNRKVEFIESTTGLMQRLRIYNDHRDPSAIVVRGKRATLAKAAEELVRDHSGIKVYQLGEVAANDYETVQLWPKIEGQDGPIGVEDTERLWVHKEEPEQHWIDTKYEDIPRPETWTREAFDAYIAKLVSSRIRPELVLTLYGGAKDGKGKDDNRYSSDGIRVRLIESAFMDPQARPFITTPTLKMALAFMTRRTVYKATADRLFTKAEEWGLPMDTEAFNIILEGYVAKRDHRYFELFLRKMKYRYYPANARTWLLFLRLVQRDHEKLQIVASMWQLGLFKDPATARGIAAAMASFDAYNTFRSGIKLDQFLTKQEAKYGDQWFSGGALNAIWKEYLNFHAESKPDPSEYAPLVDVAHKYGHTVGLDTVHIILQSCLENRDWDTAVWALRLMRQEGCEPNYRTYDLILHLAIATHSPHALAAGIFHGALDLKLSYIIRAHVKEIFALRYDDRYWNRYRPRIFTGNMADAMKESAIFSPKAAVARAIRIIHDFSAGLVPQPLDVTLASAIHHDRKMKDGDEAGPLKIEMRSKMDPDSPAKVFRLGSRFDPFTMMDGFEIRPGRAQRRATWSKVTERDEAAAPEETPPAKALPAKTVEEAHSEGPPSKATADNGTPPGIRGNRFGTLKEALDGIITEAADKASVRPALSVRRKAVKAPAAKGATPGEASAKRP